jgi:hypothetical protein
MIGRVLRVLGGLALAGLAAGLAITLFIYTPFELLEAGGDKLAEAGLLALAAATHSAVFAAPFALLAAAIGEWRRFGGWLYYLLAGIAIAGLGFLAQCWTLGGGDVSIANAYAGVAFLATGGVAGLVYWLFSGRWVRPHQGMSKFLPPPQPSAKESARAAR